MMERALLIMILLVGIINLASAELTLNYLCNTINNTSTSKESVDKIFLETNEEVDIYVIDYYKNNWDICKKVLFVTNNPSPICTGIYKFILENGYNYTQEDLDNLSLKLNISSEILSNYRYSYNNLCLSYAPTLPKEEITKIFINNSNSCNEDVDSFFSLYLPFFHIPIGKSCGNVNFLKYVFSTERNTENYKIVGIRAWILSLIVLLFIIFKISKSRRKR